MSLIDPKEGATASFTRSSAREEGVVGELGNGDAFGQEALLFNERQKWDVRAITYCDMLYLSREYALPRRRRRRRRRPVCS